MKTIEEAQKLKKDKCTLLLQTAECCDISEIIEQLKVRNLKNSKTNSSSQTTTTTNGGGETARNILIKKFNQNYVTIDALKNGVSTTSQTSFIDLSTCPKSMGSGYKVLPKYIQNIDSIGFEKPNWKPLMLNDKIENSQLSGLSITNSLTSFRGGKISYRSNKPLLNSQRDFNKLDSILNSDSHRQKSIEMNRKKTEKNRETGSSLLTSSSVTEFSNEQTQSDSVKQLPAKKLVLGPSKLKLSTVKLPKQQRRSSTITLESSQENFDDLSSSSKNEKLPLLRQPSIQNEHPFLYEHSSSFINITVNKTNNNSKLSFYDNNDKLRENSTNLADVISVSKISPLSKQRNTSITTESDSQQSNSDGREKTNENTQKESGEKSNAGESATAVDGFFSSIMKQKNELDAYLNQVREKTSLSHAPPNSPMPYEISKAQINIRVTNNKPSTPQEDIRLLRIADARKFPPTNSVGIPIASSLQLRRRQKQNENLQLQQALREQSQTTTEAKPLIKTNNNLNQSRKDRTTNKLEKNLQKKIGQNSVNMIKINNKNVKFLSNIGSQNSVSSFEDNSTHSFGTSSKKLPMVPNMNDKLRVDIYIPNLS